MAGDWDDDTVVRDSAFDDAQVTPIEVPQCPECHEAATHDDFDKPSLSTFPNEEFCVIGRRFTWWWCRRARKLVQIWP